MKVLSIDVGMKNLAFCLFEIKDKHGISNYKMGCIKSLQR